MACSSLGLFRVRKPNLYGDLSSDYYWRWVSRRKFRVAKLVVILAYPIRLPRSKLCSCIPCTTEKALPALESAEHPGCSHPPAGTTLVPSRQSCWQPWEELGEKTDGDGEEQMKGREERRFLYENMHEGQKGQKINDRRSSKLQWEWRQPWHCPAEQWGGTSLTLIHAQSTKLQRRGKWRENGGMEVSEQKTKGNWDRKENRQRWKGALVLHAENLPTS